MHVSADLRRMACIAALAGGCAPSAGPAPQHVRLHPYFRGLRTVVAWTPAGDSLRLLLDTGGGLTVFTPDRARQHACVPSGVTTGHRMTGERVDFPRCGPLTLRIDSVQVELSSYGIFDLARVLPPELPPLDGILSLDAFRGQRLVLDWAGNDLALGAAVDDPRARRPDIRLATGDGGDLLTAFAKVDDRPLWLLIDSGNLRGTLLHPEAVPDSIAAVTRSGSVTVPIGGAPWVFTPQITPLIFDGALGTDFLQSAPLVIDLSLTSGQPRRGGASRR